jgi:hypothetical protein
MANFEIIRHSKSDNVSLIIPVAASRGVAFQVDGSDPTKGKLAAVAGHFVGFLTRNVTVTGPALADHVYPGRLELDVKVGDACSLEKADAVEAESSVYLMDSGTGAIDANTAVDSPLAFKQGRFYVAQSGDTPYFKLAAHLTPEDSGNATRIRAEVI